MTREQAEQLAIDAYYRHWHRRIVDAIMDGFAIGNVYASPPMVMKLDGNDPMLENQLKQAVARVTELENQLASVTCERDTLAHDRQCACEAAKSLARRVEELDDELNDRCTELTSLRNTADEDARQIAAMIVQVDDYRKQLTASELRLEEYRKQLGTTVAEALKHSAAADMLARSNDKLCEHAKSLESHLAAARDRAEFLEHDVRSLIDLLGKKRRKKNAARITEILADLAGAS